MLRLWQRLLSHSPDLLLLFPVLTAVLYFPAAPLALRGHMAGLELLELGV